MYCVHVLCKVSDGASSKFVFTLRILMAVSNLDAKRNVSRSTCIRELSLPLFVVNLCDV